MKIHLKHPCYYEHSVAVTVFVDSVSSMKHWVQGRSDEHTATAHSSPALTIAPCFNAQCDLRNSVCFGGDDQFFTHVFDGNCFGS